MQAQNNQRLKDREFQLREMKNVMEVAKVGQLASTNRYYYNVNN